MTELHVHRLRFGNWLPSAIKSISVDRKYSNKVAVGREDGEIEILSPVDGFSAQAKVCGSADFKLQALAWSQFHSESAEAGRLFGISLKGFLFEVDFTSAALINVHDTYGGAAWSLAASPRANLLAVGGEDGIVRLFRYYAHNKLEYVKSLPTSGSRVLSLAFHPSKSQLFVGCSDGTVRCVDEESGRVHFRMTGDVHPGVFTPSIWSLAVLSDSTVVTGDSRGQVQVWDGSVGVLVASFLQHTADVLAVTASPDENRVFASGIDGKVICIQRIAEGAASDESQRQHWVYTHSHRPHTHDVLALAIVPRTLPQKKPAMFSTASSLVPFSGRAFTLLSGGLDTRLSLYSVEEYDRVRPQWLPIIPANELVSHSADHSLMTLRHKQHVDIWQVRLQSPVAADNATPSSSSSASATPASSSSVLLGPTTVQASLGEHCSLLLRLKTAGHDHLSCTALSPDGQLLLLSTASETKGWMLRRDSAAHLTLRKIRWPESLVNSGRKGFYLRALTFSADGRFLAAWHSVKKALLIFSVSLTASSSSESTETEPCPLKLIASLPYEPHESSESNEEEQVDRRLSHVIKRVVFSADNKFVAVANAAREVTVFNVNK